ncbi:probable indole-3-pyruvate monooxygenase YUCCA11 [Olea europaea subsp. europaea]|uniref:Flavin-containing monooxygenase n=1 Tax=Olea europaea subsp. europaea TaxID=158383 RepID=A0A8S0UIE5_OLEEU|nr:probable indole-3-pyruvate monooxygenase YUCCA11 [Olea europaea subsp. europaea]
MQQETVVLIIGAGPAGLATSACLNLQNIPNIVLEKEDCCASLWKKRSYDRLKLHLAKQFCELPHMPFPQNAPTFAVESASFDERERKWLVIVRNTLINAVEKYEGKFLIVATGENSEGYTPNVPGLDSFHGEVVHSSRYENGKRFDDKNVLVVGCGNSGMEIAYDLSNWGAQTSIVVRNHVHVLTKRIVQLGMVLLKIVPCYLVDNIILSLSKFKYGNLSDYGLQKPSKGPFYLKRVTGRSPVIDVGTVDKIKAQEIKVFPSINKINGDCIQFANGETKSFDAIVFATGYRSTVRKWLKDDGG